MDVDTLEDQRRLLPQRAPYHRLAGDLEQFGLRLIAVYQVGIIAFIQVRRPRQGLPGVVGGLVQHRNQPLGDHHPHDFPKQVR